MQARAADAPRASDIPGGRTPASIAARLTYENVNHRYGAFDAVRGVSLDISPGEVVCLLGNSGCGKTTLLRLAAGLETPASGRVLINGEEVSSRARSVAPERRSVGLMFQDFALFPHLTNLSNVMFGLKAMTRAEAEREARRALERLGLNDHADSYPHMLSGGEQQRVALARAVAPRPSILLMDEPFSGLDRRLRDDVRDETLAVLREARVTSVIVTHDPEEALRIGDRIALMRAGELVQVASPETIYRTPNSLFAARFFCDHNEIRGEVRSGKVQTPAGAFAASDLTEGTEAVVAIRPQAISPSADGPFAGWLVRRQFIGDADLADIALDGLQTPLKARWRPGAGPATNSAIRVTIDPAEVLVFAASEA